MKIKILQPIVDLHGEAIKTPKEEPATLRWACCEALLSTFQDERDLAAEEKVKRYQLAKKLIKEDEPDLSIEEVALIKKLIGKGFVPVVVGECFNMIEAAANAPAATL